MPVEKLPVAAAGVYLIALVAARRSPELRRLIVGLATVTAAFFAVRTLH
ncbi:MAG: hypothetical protein ACRDZ7_06840 [Acidimicrobiia bacterium]